MKILLASVLEKIETRSDGSLKIVLATQEVDPSIMANAFQLINKYCKVLISDNNISPLEEKLIDEEKLQGGKKPKSPQQRLRSVMYRVWEDQGINQDFDQWYKGEIENQINKYKEVLNNN